MARHPTVRRHIFEAKHGKKQGHRVHGSLGKHMAITELNVNRLTATFPSNFGARYEQATATYKYNQEHGWIEPDM